MHKSCIRNFWNRCLILLLASAEVSCQQHSPPRSATEKPAATAESPETIAATEGQIVAFCGGCHAMPHPDRFPKESWPQEVERGFDFYQKFKPVDLSPPPIQPVVDYFRSRAPVELARPAIESFPNPEGVRFRTQLVTLDDVAGDEVRPTAISFVASWKSDITPGKFLLSDMANGGIWLADANSPPRCLTRVRNPTVASRCDLNGNGIPDLVIADLGRFPPSDHTLGSVVWLKDVDEQGEFRNGTALARNLGRVADVEPGDFDADGDTDLVVAEFGWHKTGRILLLRNNGNRNQPSFETVVLDPRPGTIHVPVLDLNRDGHPDFVALVSQQFETIDAFLNQGNGTFAKQTIHAADDPAYGSSGIQIIDLDGDGDDDVLFSNGDIFDSFLIKPYHGIQWLENPGEFPFRWHKLTAFPGVHRALAGDLDCDGDLDIVAVAMFPSTVRDTDIGRSFDSLIWLEQTSPGQFVRHALESGECAHAAMELSDLDGDGDLEIITGMFSISGPLTQPAAKIWWNETTRPLPAK